ncbi:CBO0543 family protein [Neobacillus sp. OS1-2]|uniref:CBO0543 family protein n=1 Tax=Neobacillus sp. OS1-2 TaxID=3070680 RepID=UPI0027E0586D|nr:CBO0543 family protein [Neobacillus sp. OS1-2]WML41436.1 CBO0543 family protein [Neobacillus sp. OS1-2]
MRMEYLILAAMWLFGIIAWILFIPSNDRRKGFLAYLMFQGIVWLCDMPSFTFGLLRAPVREFPKATDLPLTINYFFYPVLFSILYVHRKVTGRIRTRMTYFFVWVTVITLFDIVLERYTDLLEYETLTWYGMWIYMVFLFYVSQVCCNWFFKDKSLFQAEWEKANEN